MTENKNTNQQSANTTNSNDKKTTKSGLKVLFESVWNSLDPQKKKYVVTFLVGLAFIIVAMVMYTARKGTAPADNNVAKQQSETKSLFIGKEEKDDKLSLAYSFEERIKRLEEQKKQEEELNKKLYPMWILDISVL
jgi:hypothetical protein